MDTPNRRRSSPACWECPPKLNKKVRLHVHTIPSEFLQHSHEDAYSSLSLQRARQPCSREKGMRRQGA